MISVIRKEGEMIPDYLCGINVTTPAKVHIDTTRPHRYAIESVGTPRVMKRSDLIVLLLCSFKSHSITWNEVHVSSNFDLHFGLFRV